MIAEIALGLNRFEDSLERQAALPAEPFKINHQAVEKGGERGLAIPTRSENFRALHRTHQRRGRRIVVEDDRQAERKVGLVGMTMKEHCVSRQEHGRQIRFLGRGQFLKRPNQLRRRATRNAGRWQKSGPPDARDRAGIAASDAEARDTPSKNRGAKPPPGSRGIRCSRLGQRIGEAQFFRRQFSPPGQRQVTAENGQ